MLVKDYMTSHPITTGPDTPIIEAQQMMRESSIRHLPVVDKGKQILGILTPSRFSVTADNLLSLSVGEITHRLTQVTVGDVMVKGDALLTTTPDATLEDAASILVTNRITGLPVVNDGIVVGVVTQTDLLAQLYYLLGGSEPGVRVAMRMPDRNGELGKIYGVVYGKGWGMRAVGGLKSPVVAGKWDAVIKVHRCETVQEVVDALSVIEDQEILDARTSKDPASR